jgi:hypothetical protein
MWANVNPNIKVPQPGTLNYVEGQASIGSQPLNSQAVGSTELQPGQVLATQNGRVEILLTPGVLLRLDNNSAIQMDSNGLANTALTLQQGRALIEVSEIRKENDIVINEDGMSARLLKRGVYEFNANTNEVRVFDGEAQVMARDKKIDVGGGHLLALNDAKLKTHGFNKKESEDEFYRWASLRSSYLAEANVDAARVYVSGGSGWYGPGWYWDPWFSAYTWIPGAGVLWSPFGWGFYSPFAVWSAPAFLYGGIYGPYYHQFGAGYRPPVVTRPAIGFARGGFAPRAGFAGGMHAVGGFHGGRR